jgi:hypothetical protein
VTSAACRQVDAIATPNQAETNRGSRTIRMTLADAVAEGPAEVDGRGVSDPASMVADPLGRSGPGDAEQAPRPRARDAHTTNVATGIVDAFRWNSFSAGASVLPDAAGVSRVP